MNKADLISAVAAEAGLSKVDAKKAVEAFVSTVTKALQEGDKVSLIGFGTFSVAERSARTGINPSTKATITIPAKKVTKFKPGAELADAIKYIKGLKERGAGTSALSSSFFYLNL